MAVIPLLRPNALQFPQNSSSYKQTRGQKVRERPFALASFVILFCNRPFSCPVPSGLPHRSHCVPVNMIRYETGVFCRKSSCFLWFQDFLFTFCSQQQPRPQRQWRRPWGCCPLGILTFSALFSSKRVYSTRNRQFSEWNSIFAVFSII